LDAWRHAGFEVFKSLNMPSRAFAEGLAAHLATPRISAHKLAIMRKRGDPMVVLDVRPRAAFRRATIPGALHCPASELVYRIHDIAPDPDATVVCIGKGRRRAFLGAQALIDARVPNMVVALEDGIRGWRAAGYDIERNAPRAAPGLSEEGLRLARVRAARLARRAEVVEISGDDLARARGAADRTTFLFDIRPEEEFVAGHLPESINAIGVELAARTDDFIAALGARVVVTDDDGARARLVAAWLRRMGWDACVLIGAPGSAPVESGAVRPRVLGFESATAESVAPRMLAVNQMRGRGRVHLLDLSRAATFRRGHVAGARFAIRARLAESLGRLPPGDVVLTSEDGTLARLAAPEVAATGRGVKVLAGGNAAWRREKLSWDEGPGDPLDPFEDESFDGAEDVPPRDLLAQVERDGDARFDLSDFSKD
jgi:rhodanese-related sulfurtransferase